MIKLPTKENGNWTVQYESSKLPDLVQTRNLNFDKSEKIALSKPSIAFYSETDDADFGIPVKFARALTNNVYMLMTGDRPFFFSLEAGNFFINLDDSTNSPTGQASNTHGTIFDNELVVSETDDIKTWDFSYAWTDQVVTLDSGNIHPIENFVSQNEVAVTDETNTVIKFSTAYAESGTKLTIPSDYRICSMAYNRGYLGIATYDARFNGNGYFFIWDGNTAAANYAYPLNTYAGTTVIPYKDTFIVYTSASQLLTWTGSGLEEVATFPSYYTGGTSHTTYLVAAGDTHANGYVLDGSRFYLNKNGELNEADSRGRKYINGESGGIWAFEPNVGLYHRHGTTARTLVRDFLNEGSVNTTTDQITVAAAPDTGTPVYYTSSGDTAVGGLTNGKLYYTIKVDATHVQLATTYANAIAGTEVTLTSDITDPVVLTSAVTIATDYINFGKSGVAAGTSHPIVYNANGGTEIGGLTDGTTYYVHNDSFANRRISSSASNALELTQIDLTGTGNDSQTFSLNAHALVFIPKSDFGQQYLTEQQGCLDVYDRTEVVYGSGRTIAGGGLLWGANAASTSTAEVYAGGLTLRETENRGYFVTSMFQSQQMQDDWQKIFLKHNKLSGEFDEIHLKYRIREEDLVNVGLDEGGAATGLITWSDSDTFTSTDTQYADVKTQVDAGNDVEIEVVQGAGSGYLLHVDSITEAGGTYTVNLKESVKNISASDTARAIASRWNYLTKIDSDTTQNDDGYSEIAVGVKSKAIQFKVELRGEDVEVEEILIANTLHKPVA